MKSATKGFWAKQLAWCLTKVTLNLSRTYRNSPPVEDVLRHNTNSLMAVGNLEWIVATIEFSKPSNVTAESIEPNKPETKVVVPMKKDSSTEDNEVDIPGVQANLYELNLQRDQLNIHTGLWTELQGRINTEDMMCHLLTQHLQSNWPAHCADTLICNARITDGAAGKHASVTLWSIVTESNDFCPSSIDQIEESIVAPLRSDDKEWTVHKSSDQNQVHYAQYIVMHTSPISGKWMKFGLQLLREKRLEIGGLHGNARIFTISLPKTQPLIPEAQIIQEETGQFEYT
ncbi:hypothetical protein CLF_103010, partial [Clonorchis sinensis]